MGNGVENLRRSPENFVALVDIPRKGRLLAEAGIKISIPDVEAYSLAGHMVAPCPPPHHLSELQQVLHDVIMFLNVLIQRPAVPHRLDRVRFCHRDNRRVVDTPSHLDEAFTDDAEPLPQYRYGKTAQFATGVDAEELQVALHLFADATQVCDGNVLQRAGHVLGVYEDKAVRFFHVRSKLREELVGCDPDGAGDVESSPYPGFQEHGDVFC